MITEYRSEWECFEVTPGGMHINQRLIKSDVNMKPIDAVKKYAALLDRDSDMVVGVSGCPKQFTVTVQIVKQYFANSFTPKKIAAPLRLAPPLAPVAQVVKSKRK